MSQHRLQSRLTRQLGGERNAGTDLLRHAISIDQDQRHGDGKNNRQPTRAN
ncbi:MAG: hypothetical protein ACXWLZ_04895 [Rhizomicrobium sp.]